MTVVRGFQSFPITQTGTSSGTFASRPSASSAGIGHVYTATDVGLVYVSTGIRWVIVELTSSGSGGGSAPTGTGFRHVASGTEDAAAKLVEVADVAGSLKPSGTAAGTDESLRRLGTGSTHAAAGDDSRFPSSGEKNALAGTSGTPGSGNKYVTDGDSRNTDARTPTGSASGVLSGTYPNPGFAADMATQAELDAHTADTSAAHAASAVSADSTTLVGTGTDVQAVLEELDDGIADHLADTSAAHTASAISFSATGSISATDAQAAIAEVASEAQPLDSDLTAVAGLDSSTAGAIASDGAGWIKKTYAQFKTALSLVKADVGLGNVDNTTDAGKPVSTAQQTALDLKANAARIITSGAALTGGGDLSADRTLDVAVDGSTIEVSSDALRVKALGITDAHVATANKDGTAATASLRTLGTGAAQAASGNDSRLSDSRAPSGSAGGVLDGSYPSPGLAAGVAGDGLAETSDVLSVNVDGSTLEINSDSLRVKALGITDAHVAAANKDGTAATPSLRTIGTGAAQAAGGTDSRLSDSRAPNGSAGGVLSGTYPSPGFAADMATQAELDAHVNDTSAAHAASAISYAGGTGISSTDVEAALDELATEKANTANVYTNQFISTTDETVPANSQLIIEDVYEISSNFATEISSTGLLTLQSDVDETLGFTVSMDQGSVVMEIGTALT